MGPSELQLLAEEARREWEQDAIDYKLLCKLYRKWVEEFGLTDHRVELDDYGIRSIVQLARHYFPKGCCGVASCWLARKIPDSKLVHGAYQIRKKKWFGLKVKVTEEPHTWIETGDTIIDITADQFGGPKIYIGPVKEPYKNLP